MVLFLMACSQTSSPELPPTTEDLIQVYNDTQLHANAVKTLTKAVAMYPNRDIDTPLRWELDDCQWSVSEYNHIALNLPEATLESTIYRGI